MGVPTSEVGYTTATTRRETTKVHKNMWWHWGGGSFLNIQNEFSRIFSYVRSLLSTQVFKRLAAIFTDDVSVWIKCVTVKHVGL